MDFSYKQISEKSIWYTITDSDDKEYGLFSIISVPRDPPYIKNLELIINDSYAKDIIEEDNLELLVSICKFTFESVLKITDAQGMKKCKIRARDDLVLMIYKAFGEALEQLNIGYEMESHGRWVVINKKNP